MYVIAGAEKWAAERRREAAKRLGLPPLFIPTADPSWFPRTAGELTEWLRQVGAYEGPAKAHTALGTAYTVSDVRGFPGAPASAAAASYASICERATAYADLGSQGAYPGVPYLTFVVREWPDSQDTHGIGRVYIRAAFEAFDLNGELLIGSIDEIYAQYRRDPKRFVADDEE